MIRSDNDQQTNLDRKRIRVILSGDEDERHDEVDCSREGSIDSQRRMLLLLMDVRFHEILYFLLKSGMIALFRV